MATGFSVMDALNKNTKAGVEDTSPKGKFRTKDLSISRFMRMKAISIRRRTSSRKRGKSLRWGCWKISW